MRQNASPDTGWPHSIHGIKRIAIYLCLMVALAALLAGASACTHSVAPTPLQKKVLNVGMILGSAGLGDKSFNDSAYAGLLAAQRKLNIRFETVNFTGQNADVEALRAFANNGYDLIIGVSFDNMPSLQSVAREYPAIKFGAIDFELAGDNIASIVYREQEGDFLMGTLAAMVTGTHQVAVIGGSDMPSIRRIMAGFQQGVAYQDHRVAVFTDLAGTFSDPQVGYKLALSRYNQGVDVIHNAASKTGLGIIQAAQEVGKYVTGTSGDQRYLAPGFMIGNRPKRVDTAVQILIEEVSENTFTTGIRSLGLKENGFSLGPFDDSVVTPAMLKTIDEIKQKIINGEVQVKVE
jgi:basic membrane protein A and related proteins